MVLSNEQNPQPQTRTQKAVRLRRTINEQWRGAGDESAVDELAADRRAATAREESVA